MKKLFLVASLMLAVTMTAFADLNIGTKLELENFRNAVNNGNTYSGQTVRLTADIDLGGASWTPIGNKEKEGDTGFAGTFDGQGHTISNFQVSLDKEVSKLASVSTYNKNAFGGLWGINNGTIKNLKVSEAKVSTIVNGIQNSACSGAIAGLNRGTINNCQVINSTMSATQNYGASSLTAEHMALSGGVAGASRAGSTVSNCYVYGNTLNTSKDQSSAGSEKNDIACTWQTDGAPNRTNCCTSTDTYTASWRKGRVDAAAGYVNNLAGTDEPYYWDANGITTYVPYAFRVDETNARTAASYATVVDDTYTVGGATYNLYPAAGQVIDVTAYPLGVATSGADAGYKLADNARATINAFADNFANNADSRYYRTQTAQVTLPTSYPTDATVLSMEHTGYYGVEMANPSENISDDYDAYYDKSVGIEYNGKYFYAVGTEVPVTVYPLGMKVNGEDDGYVLADAEALGAVTTDLNYVEGDRYVREVKYNHVVTDGGLNTIFYQVENTGLYRLTLADHGVDAAVRNDAVILTEPTIVTSPIGEEFPMYHQGDVVTLEFYLEGFSGDWSDAGYYIDALIINGSSVTGLTPSYVSESGNDENGDPTYSYETNRFLRKMQYEINMPAQVTTVGYTTMTTITSSVEDANADATRIYGIDDAVVVEATAQVNVVIADMTGRIVFNGVVSEGRNEIALAAGIYIVNGVKVAVR